MSLPTLTLEAAQALDRADPFARFREEFHFPVSAKGERALYFTGNSLGLQPKSTRDALLRELEDWARLGVEGHLHARRPWYPYHELVREPLARVVGALPREVVAMNTLTTNLHLLMVSFYLPTRERSCIVIEDSAFPSDSYAVQSQVDFHAPAAGFDPRRGVLRLRPREGEHTLRTDDILDLIDQHASSIALLLLGGVNYLTGQYFDIPAITGCARERGITVGWDLAHAAGNMPLRLHDWGVDFAAWCSYKYLNAGPGAIAGAFVHERHLDRTDLPRFAGWWGNDPATRFDMTPDFAPVASADAWSLSNPPIFSTTPLVESLAIFDRAGGVDALRAKSVQLTRALTETVRAIPGVRVITPDDPAARGCQLSLLLPGDAREAHRRLTAAGVMADFREPDVVRVAPTPLYNSFEEIWHFGEILRRVTAH
ncbi:MAG: kynureninase [Phycisphaeraceae bacterium]|nr:kynureninase [Phycisphaeraceae bacterium]MCW5753990.1 kynureninase [Phycisphaeraceae bacterium]